VKNGKKKSKKKKKREKMKRRAIIAPHAFSCAPRHGQKRRKRRAMRHGARLGAPLITMSSR